MHKIAGPRLSPPRLPSAPAQPAEVGGEKTLTQHLGNAGFGASSVAAFTDSMGTMLDTVVSFPGVEAVPGLNLGVAAIETYNSVKKLKEHDPIVAATSAGNAAGSLGTFLAQVSLAPALLARNGAIRSGLLLGMGAALGAVGGGLGIAAGVAEIRKGLEIKEAGGSSRTLVMGCLDISSGVTSLAGAGAMAMGAAPVGITLMMLANLIDVAGIGVDYLWKRMGQKPAQAKAEPGPVVQAGNGTEARTPATLVEFHDA
ncbi:hypothetical protein IV102_17025 [bacterium]|nr:hypothetical protein [bacterium]